MPLNLRPKSTRSAARTRNKVDHLVFYPLLTLCLIVWFIYRSVFNFPIWFDESLGKAIFFGLPVWLYIAISGAVSIADTFSVAKIKRGLLLGVAVGGVYGFAASLASLLLRGDSVQAVPLFSSQFFWWEFLMSLLTGFWETLFFFSWIMVVIQEKYQHWSTFKQSAVVSALFLIFHLPNTVKYFEGQFLVLQLVLLALFAFGQALLFARRRNAYALVLSHAIWGMVLLVHVR
jgi:hypothetical protein